MCGIVGRWRRAGRVDTATVERMRDAIRYRGPDDAGTWCEGPVALGHRRLSILDLSPLGHQPMASADGRFVICFNGEVFNFQDLRRELEGRGHRFSGNSDTEVMLAALSSWGVRAAVERFVGMFAFALWDRREGELHLVRDRIGIKPLYIGRTQRGDFLFASELKAFAAHPDFSRRVNPDAVVAYLTYGYVPAPQCIYADAAKLEPGHLLTLGSPSAPWSATPYWSLEGAASSGAADPFRGSADEAEEALDGLLREAVRLRMISDVPLGAFLSGGVDSSTVVALMQAQSSRPVQTFTIGFTEARFNEASFARGIARHLGTDHTELLLTPAETMAVIPRLAEMYDEPLADASQIPTFLVSELARRRVTETLSGDGGDELFGGYARYLRTERAWRALGWLPAGARRGLGLGIRVAGAIAGVGTGERARKLGEWLGAADPARMYERLVVTDSDPRSLLAAEAEDDTSIQRLVTQAAGQALPVRFMLADARLYRPDDLLTKLDRASMAVSLEGRVPLLDDRVVEFAWRLPGGMRRRMRLLRGVLGRYVSLPLFARPKMGFEIALAEWLRGPLRHWAARHLADGAARQDAVLDGRAVGRAWHQFADRGGGNPHLVWGLLMLQAWRERWSADF